MTLHRVWTTAVVVCLFSPVILLAQQPSAVPRLIKFSGTMNPQLTQTPENEKAKNPSPTSI
ncbi:MAG: hypothetical protein ACLQOO_01390, partial [Terriglobia bacterium]